VRKHLWTGPAAMVLVCCLLAAPAMTAESEGKRVHVSLSGVTLHALVQYMSEFSGKPVLLPEQFPGDRRLEIVSSASAGVPPEKVMNIFASALRSIGYGLMETENYIQVFPEGKETGVQLERAVPLSGLSAESLITTVVNVENVEAAKLVEVLTGLKSRTGAIRSYQEGNTLVIKDYGPNLATMMKLIHILDRKWGERDFEMYRLENSSVQSLQGVVKSYVANLEKTADPMARKRLKGFMVTTHVPNNAFLLFGHPQDVSAVKALIQRLDVKPDFAARSYHTYMVLHRDAPELVKVLSGVFAAQRARAGGAAAVAPPAVIADETNNALIVIATQEKYEELLPFIKQLDRPKSQVLIESAFVEMSTEKLLDIGVEGMTLDPPVGRPRGFGITTFGLSSLTEDGRIPILPPSGGLTAGVFKEMGIAAIIRLSAQDEDVSFIAAPRLMASDNKLAIVTIKQEREFQKSIVTPEGRTSEVVSGGFHDAEIRLEILPHINDQGMVRLQITAQIDEFLPSTMTETGALVNRSSRKAETEVLVPDGTTVVIAGLTRNRQSETVQKVPVLGDIPVLGFFFRRTSNSLEQRNLCIFITPHILTTQEDLAAETAASKKAFDRTSRSGKPAVDKTTLDHVTGGRVRDGKAAAK